MNPKVSIIIPVYNAEKHIRRCIESVLKQDFVDFELILMNDGSKDSSGEICDEYAKNDSRIIVIHKENTGVSDTRNQAISMARGEYLQFLDSDDWIIPEATGLLVRMADEHQCDMVIADFYRVVGERLSQKGQIRENEVLTREAFAMEMMENPADFYYGVLWNKLYKKNLIQEHRLFMDKDISWCEDFIFNMEYIRHVTKVYALHVPIYYYVKTPGSLVSQGTSISKTIQMKRMVFKCYKEFYKDVFGEEDYEKIRFQVYRFLIDAAGDGSAGFIFMTNTMKLGDERISVSANVADGEGILFDAYREFKLLDRYLETVAIKYDLSFEDAKVLFYFSQVYEGCTTKEISQVTQIKKRKLAASIQKLVSKGYISVKTLEDQDKKKNVLVECGILSDAEPVILDLLSAKTSYLKVKYAGLSEEEIEQYEILSTRMRENIQKALK